MDRSSKNLLSGLSKKAVDAINNIAKNMCVEIDKLVLQEILKEKKSRLVSYVTTFCSKWVSLHTLKSKTKDGKEIEWEMISRNKIPKIVSGNITKPDAVIIVPYYKEKDALVLIKEFRYPIDNYEWGFPAGLIDDNETIEEAAERELREETGLSISKILDKTPPLFSSTGLTDESVVILTVECYGEISTKYNEDNEYITIFLWNKETIKEKIKDPNLIFGAKEWLTLNNFVKTGNLF